ncbi:synaptotagmin-14-like [Teleopsis dalmanni]|uniref:synaptotagmin-14-like n=2 Tax=Teleopsis dalmanni TaxID=139649 RepID=UPI0018CCA805|nr:synaptotagmin-14-like [Teleopsis dalmanni]
MIVISGVDNYYLNGTVEITTVLGAFFGVIALMFLFFLYVNRKWCFHARHGLNCCNEKNFPSKYVQKISRKRRYENTSSDSEEDILRRLRLQQQRNNNLKANGQFTSYGINQFSPLSHNYSYNQSELQRVTVTPRESSRDDPLAIAERGKVGIPSSHSECSSNDSVEASIDSHTGLLISDKRDRQIIGSNKTTDGSAASSLKESRIETKADVIKPIKLQKLSTSSQRQDSLDDVPDLQTNNNHINNNNNNEDEPLFDTSDLRSVKSDEVSVQNQCYGKSGSIEISLLYDAPMRKMTVHVLQARGLPNFGNIQQTHTQVRLLMLPSKKQKHKTKIRSGENPQYMESFLLHRVNPEEVNGMGLRVRVYGCERLRKERLVGEAYVSFATIDLELETNLWLPLEPRNTSSIMGSTSDLLSLARSESAGSTTSMQHGGVSELLLGLGYNGITGRLTVEIVKGSQFRCLSLSKAPDTYVKLCLVSSIGQEISRAKTSTRRGQPNPLFKETFVFQVALFQLNDVTLMVSVYAKRNMKKNEMVGWFSLGLNSSGPEEVAHWMDVRELPKGELLMRWHVLVDS